MSAVETGSETQRLRLGASLRQEDRVLPLELFFDLVFVLAITQCTTLMSENSTWEGLGQGMLVLALLWWSWVGYAWLTSVVDPEEGGVRFALFAAMAGFLIAAISIPEVFGSLATEFAVAYGAVRFAQIFLLAIAGRDDPSFRRSVTGLGIGTAIGVALLVFGSFLDPGPQAAVWGLALILDMSEPYLFGSEGWHLVPGHFAERHGLVIIIAIGESIVSIGVGFAGVHLSWGPILVAVLGLCIAYYLYWFYFAGDDARGARVLAATEHPLLRARLALQAWGYAHYTMLLGIIIASVGIKMTVSHATDPLHWGQASALGGGVALYLLGHAAFLAQLRLRGVPHRLVAATLALATIPLGHLVALAQLIALPAVMVVTAMVEDLPEVRRTGSTAIGTFGRTPTSEESP